MRLLVPALLITGVAAVHAYVEFEPYTTVLAGGELFDAGWVSSPTFADWDGDGLRDLIVGSMVDTTHGRYGGHLTLCLNSGTPDSPVFTYATPMYADGKEIVLPGDS